MVAVRIENRAQLIYLLTEGAELEHEILCCYLFASFSMKDDVSEGVTAEQLEAIRSWRATVREIIVQEMIHLAIDCNLLTAVGGAPRLSRPNLPTSPRAYPPAFKLELVPFSLEAVEQFVNLERPDDPATWRADYRSSALPFERLSDVFSTERGYETVGQLYRGIQDGLTYLSQKLGEDQLFVGPQRAQTAEPYFGLPGLRRIHDLDSALASIQVIVEQGEGATEDHENSHYRRFVEIRDEYRSILADDPDFQPARPVLRSPYASAPSDLMDEPGVQFLDDPLSVDICNLFDSCYELMVQILGRLFAHTGESEDELMALADIAVSLMLEVIEPLGCALTLLPAGPSHPGLAAGPSFRLSRAAEVPPHAGAARTTFRERLNELAAYSRYVATIPKAPVLLPGLHGILSGYAARLE